MNVFGQQIEMALLERVLFSKRLISCLNSIRGERRRSFASFKPQISVAWMLRQKPEADKLQDFGEVKLNGFIHSIRNQKQRSFASIGDGSCLETLQALLTPAQAKGSGSITWPSHCLSFGTAVRVTGSWRPSPHSSEQSHELHVSNLDVIGPNDSTYPLQKKYQTPEFLRAMPHLRVRTPFNSTLLRFRSDVISNVSKTFSEMSFTQCHTPIMTSCDCEGAGDVFQVDQSYRGAWAADKQRLPNQGFFRSPKYLTVSSQLHLEALSQAVGNVWSLSPTFRAERSDTSRHLSEFYMLEAEMRFIKSIDEVINLIQLILCSVVQNLYQTQTSLDIFQGHLSSVGSSGDEKELKRRWDGIIKKDWKRITYSEAINILQLSSINFQHKPKWGLSLQTEHEKYIANTIGITEDYIIPVFVTHFPRALKPFYMLPSKSKDLSQEESTVECFDLLVPEIGEIAGGSMREHRLEPLLESMFTKGLISHLNPSDQDLGDLKWYVDLRKWGSVPHGGFGLGFDRILRYLSGVPHIREVVTFPRWVGRCDC